MRLGDEFISSSYSTTYHEGRRLAHRSVRIVKINRSDKIEFVWFIHAANA